MCLKRVMKGKEKKEELAKLPDVITVWKVVQKWGPGDYETEFRGFPIHAGEVKFKQNVIIDGCFKIYRGGGHFFLSRSSAYRWCYGTGVVVKCSIKKEWINSIGEQYGKVVVVKKAIFPNFIGKKA